MDIITNALKATVQGKKQSFKTRYYNIHKFECAPTCVMYKKQKIEQLKLANLFQSAETCAYQAIQHYQQ